MKHKNILIIIVGFVTITLIATIKPAVASDWFVDQPEVKLVAENEHGPTQTYWGAPCTTATFKAQDVSGASGERTECAHFADYGLMSGHGLRLAGTDTSYELRSQTGAKMYNYYPIPSSNHLMFLENAGGTGGSFYVRIFHDIPNNFSAVRTQNGVRYYKLSSDYQASDTQVLKTNNQKVIIRDRSLGYSPNGTYISGNSGAYQTVINTDTRQARIFGINTLVSGEAPDTRTSVNAKGSLVFVNNTRANQFVLYNTDVCTPGATVGDPELCQNRDLTNVIKSAIPNLRMVSQARFITNSSIELFASEYDPTGLIYNRYIISTQGSATTGFEYLGLGDSFASGEGSFNYKTTTDVEENRCHLSLSSYPYLLSSGQGFNASESVACSGAKIKDVLENPRVEYKDDKPQAEGLLEESYNEQIYSNFLPGYRRQQQFVGRYKPSAITLSVGGNDIDFAKKLSWCVAAPNSCYGSEEMKLRILGEIKAQFEPLVKTYQNLIDLSPETRLYVIGYPLLAKPDGNCAVNVRLSNEEVKLSENIITDLNTVIKAATEKVGVAYVDVSQAFAGHRLCETDSWDVAVNGLTAGNDALPVIGYPIGKESYHPNKLGHELYAQAIRTATNDLTDTMPAAQTGTNIDEMASALVPIPDPQPQTVKTQPVEAMSPDVVVRGSSFGATTIPITGQFFEPGSAFQIEIHSDPQVIGTAIAAGSQAIDISAAIPESLEFGLHTVHILGNNIVGEQVDLYKDVFVVASEEDYDGDGVPNSTDKCQFVEVSGLDVDQDGVDDACDPLIDKAPVVEPPAPQQHPGLAWLLKQIKRIVQALVNRFHSLIH